MKKILFIFSLVLMLFLACGDPIEKTQAKKIEKIVRGDYTPSNTDAGKAVDDGAGKAVDDGAGKAVDGGAGKAVDDGAGKAVDGGAGKAVDDGAGKAVDGGAGKAIEVRHTVTFDSDSGSEVADVEVSHGETVSKPSDPTKTGYRFDGWYEEVARTNKVDFTTKTITEDLTLYAKWEIKVYTVTFDSDSGSEVADVEVSHGETVTKPSDPTRASYRFDGWYAEVARTTKVDFTTKTITEDVTLYAKWIHVFQGTTVLPGAFQKTGLTELTADHFPSGVTEIQAEAFAENNLRTLTNLPTSLKEIGSNAFYSNAELVEVTLPEGVTDIGVQAFKFCNAITTLRLPSTLKRIGAEAFGSSGYGMAARAVILPEGLQSIGAHAFAYNRLSEITIPKSVTSIGPGAFSGSTTLRKAILTSKLYNEIKARSGGLNAVFSPLVTTYRDHEGNELN